MVWPEFLVAGNLFTLVLLAVLEVADSVGNSWAALTSANTLAAPSAVMMTGVAIVSLTYRALPGTPKRFSWDGQALAGMNVRTLASLCWLG